MTLRRHDRSRTFGRQPIRNKDLLTRIWTIITDEASYFRPSNHSRSHDSRTTNRRVARSVSWSVPLLFTILWIYTLWWGERAIFQWQVKGCSWNRWESWVHAVSPLRFIFFGRAILITHSPRMRSLIISFCWLILNWSTPTPTLAVHGPFQL